MNTKTLLDELAKIDVMKCHAAALAAMECYNRRYTSDGIYDAEAFSANTADVAEVARLIYLVTCYQEGRQA